MASEQCDLADAVAKAHDGVGGVIGGVTGFGDPLPTKETDKP